MSFLSLHVCIYACAMKKAIYGMGSDVALPFG
jgi:hypothetical protein